MDALDHILGIGRFGFATATLLAGATDLAVESNLKGRRWPHLWPVRSGLAILQVSLWLSLLAGRALFCG